MLHQSNPPNQDQLVEARQRLAAIAKSSNDAIIGKDLDGIVTSWNAAAETMFGYAADEIVGRPVTVIIPPDRLDEEATILGRVRRGEKLTLFETLRQCKNGRIIPVSLTISPIRDDAGAIIGVSKIARDLTERREHERQLAELQAELIHVSRVNDMAHLASALAHEINQPLTAIINYVNGMRRLLAAGKTAATEQTLVRIAEQADRAKQIIEHLRDLMQKGETVRQPEDLRSTIHETNALLAGITHRLKVHVAVDAECRNGHDRQDTNPAGFVEPDAQCRGSHVRLARRQPLGHRHARR